MIAEKLDLSYTDLMSISPTQILFDVNIVTT